MLLSTVILSLLVATMVNANGYTLYDGLHKLERLQHLSNIQLGSRLPISEVYDFIVVGSSPGGCVVTNRLTEDPNTSVLLIEAGIEDNFLTDIPLLNPYLVLSDYNWNFLVDYDPRVCKGMYGGICPWPAGKGTGGGTVINGMLWTRGNRRDYDEWAAQGNTGWSFNDVLRYFLKVERTLIPHLTQSKYRGHRGPVSISYPNYVTPLLEAFIEAGATYGYKEVDYNNPHTHVGFSPIQLSYLNGERVSAATAYLRPIINRPNFRMTLRSRVTKILIDPNTKKAYGVVYRVGLVEREVYARKEVILAAGAFNSPQLLMLSGIGHRQHLQDMGIPLIQNLPVGDNLMEHYGMHGLTFLVNQTVTLVPPRLIGQILQVLPEYLLNSRGPFTSVGLEGVGYIQTKYANKSIDRPDMELLLVVSSLSADAGLLLRRTFGISDELYEGTYRGIDGLDSFLIWPMLLYPESRGYVRLRNNDPLSKVRIVGNYVSTRRDVLTIVEGLKTAVALTKTPAFQRFGTKLYTKPFPQCVQFAFGTDEYWDCAIHTVTTQLHHQSGTCRMGAVVDPRLRVYGVSGLRVVDASIIPTIPGGHTQAAAYMIGEKAADMIKADWRSK